MALNAIIVDGMDGTAVEHAIDVALALDDGPSIGIAEVVVDVALPFVDGHPLLPPAL